MATRELGVLGGTGERVSENLELSRLLCSGTSLKFEFSLEATVRKERISKFVDNARRCTPNIY
jgi:hypothetical protein